MKQKINRFFLIFSVSVSAVATLYMLYQRFCYLQMGLLYDELYSMASSNPQYPFSFIWHQMMLQDINPPLYNTMLYLWNSLVGMSVSKMRLFSALAGALAIAVSYLYAPPKWPGLKKFIFAALTACSAALAVFSIYVRSYAWAILSVYVFTLAALRIAECLNKHQYPAKTLWTVFFVSGLVGAYLHFFSAALFFITALLLFIYACCYKTARKTVFWGTAAAFALWMPWLAVTYRIMAAPTGIWYYDAPWPRATWEILQYLLGSSTVLVWIFSCGILAAVSFVYTYRSKLLQQVDLILSAGQILLLVSVVAAVSFKYNLWMVRYFSILLPSILLLLTGLLYHLYERHRPFILLLPALLLAWGYQYMKMDFKHIREFTGLKDAFHFAVTEMKADTLLIDTTQTGYTEVAFLRMMEYYIPPHSGLEIKPLNNQTVREALQEPKAPVLIPLCTQIHLIETSLKYGLQKDQNPYIFGQDVCLLTVHRLAGK